MKSKRELFPITTSVLGRPPTRADLFWARDHFIRMSDALNESLSPYVYMHTIPESTKLRALESDLNRNGLPLWPIRLTTNARIVCARSALKRIRSNLHTILKEYH